jgi:putative GTP pyrophosphokinase
MMALTDRKRLDELVDAYARREEQIKLFRDQLLLALNGSAKLSALVHSMRSRIKDPKHLREKLERKVAASKLARKKFDISPDNLLVKINDLVGIRILHLHTRQIQQIDAVLKEIFEENQYSLIEGPFARTWDDESRTYFHECKIATQESPSMYTSVHYVIESVSRTKVTAEIQVRTLSEEVWGEVDHSMNYPHPSKSLPCREQLKVLARVTSSATRLVDSIFMSLEDHRKASTKKARSPKKRKGS